MKTATMMTIVPNGIDLTIMSVMRMARGNYHARTTMLIIFMSGLLILDTAIRC